MVPSNGLPPLIVGMEEQHRSSVGPIFKNSRTPLQSKPQPQSWDSHLPTSGGRAPHQVWSQPNLTSILSPKTFETSNSPHKSLWSQGLQQHRPDVAAEAETKPPDLQAARGCPAHTLKTVQLCRVWGLDLGFYYNLGCGWYPLN